MRPATLRSSQTEKMAETSRNVMSMRETIKPTANCQYTDSRTGLSNFLIKSSTGEPLNAVGKLHGPKDARRLSLVTDRDARYFMAMPGEWQPIVERTFRGLCNCQFGSRCVRKHRLVTVNAACLVASVCLCHAKLAVAINQMVRLREADLVGWALPTVLEHDQNTVGSVQPTRRGYGGWRRKFSADRCRACPIRFARVSGPYRGQLRPGGVRRG